MIPVLAEVVFATWQAIFLIVLCFGSLAASLYCIFFMVPLRSFMKHVNSLGGGMEGIRSHVEGVREEIDTRLNELEEDLHTALAEHKEGVSNSVADAERIASGNKEQLESLADTVQELKQTLANTRDDLQELDDQLTTLRTRHASLNSNVQGLEGEIEGAVQKTVRDAYANLEGSILGALEALQDEMLRPPSAGGDEGQERNRKSSGPAGHYRSRSSDESDEYADKIISAEPLFSEVDGQSDSGEDVNDEHDENDEDHSDE